MKDSNCNYNEHPAGLRFITTLSEALITAVNNVSSTEVEYGYAVGTEDNILAFTRHYGVTDAQSGD